MLILYHSHLAGYVLLMRRLNGGGGSLFLKESVESARRLYCCTNMVSYVVREICQLRHNVASAIKQ